MARTSSRNHYVARRITSRAIMACMDRSYFAFMDGGLVGNRGNPYPRHLVAGIGSIASYGRSRPAEAAG